MKFFKQLLCILTAAVLLVSVLALPSAAGSLAVPMTSAVLVDGTEKKFEAFSINGSSYFRVRNIARALSGTAKQFQMTYDGVKCETDLTSHTAYTPSDGDTEGAGAASLTATPVTTYNIYLDGTKLFLTTYYVGIYYYVRLRDLAAALDFGVKYVAESNAIAIDTSTGYTPDKAAGSSSSSSSQTSSTTAPPASSSSAVITPSDLSVTMIGDSVGIGVEPYLKKYFPALDNNSKVSRQFYEAKGIVQTIIQGNKLAPTVIIELGTNGTVKESDMRALIDLIGSDRKIVFVNCSVPRSWCEGDNKTIAKVTADYPNTAIADWYSISVDHSGYFVSDHVHPSKSGAAALAKVIADAVNKLQ